MRIDSIKALEQWRQECRKTFETPKRKVLVCLGEGCLANGSEAVFDEFKTQVADKKIKNLSVEAVSKTGCHGFCSLGPLVIIEPEGTFYTKVNKNSVAKIVDETLAKQEVIERLLYKDAKSGKRVADYHEIPFYARQQRSS
jgi:(2Fe-2S) ferredoxin